jgi:hypothetical protein
LVCAGIYVVVTSSASSEWDIVPLSQASHCSLHQRLAQF